MDCEGPDLKNTKCVFKKIHTNPIVLFYAIVPMLNALRSKMSKLFYMIEA